MGGEARLVTGFGRFPGAPFNPTQKSLAQLGACLCNLALWNSPGQGAKGSPVAFVHVPKAAA